MSYSGTELTAPLLGINYIVNPFEEVSKIIFDIVQSGVFLNSSTFPHTPFILCSLPITKGSPAIGLMLSQVRTKFQTEFVLTGIQRGTETFLPSGGTTIQEGDTLAVITFKDKMADLLEEFDATMALPSGLGGFTGYGIGRLIHQIPNVRKWTEINLQGKNGNVLRQYGAFGVFLAGITPIPFTTVCWFSGIFRINPKQVVIACFTSRLLRMMVVVSIYAIKRGYPRSKFPDGKTFRSSLRAGILPLLAPIILLVGIYGGVFTPTESAAIVVLYSLFLDVAMPSSASWRHSSAWNHPHKQKPFLLEFSEKEGCHRYPAGQIKQTSIKSMNWRKNDT